MNKKHGNKAKINNYRLCQASNHIQKCNEQKSVNEKLNSICFVTKRLGR